MKKWMITAILLLLPTLSYAQGPLPKCFSEAVLAAENYALFEKKSLADVELTGLERGVQYLVTFRVKSKGNEGTAKYKVELTSTCSNPRVTTISIAFDGENYGQIGASSDPNFTLVTSVNQQSSEPVVTSSNDSELDSVQKGTCPNPKPCGACYTSCK